jgi:hypothetical protein
VFVEINFKWKNEDPDSEEEQEEEVCIPIMRKK